MPTSRGTDQAPVPYRSSAPSLLVGGFLLILSLHCALFAQTAGQSPVPPYLDLRRPLDERVADLVGRMTLDEKVKQMLYDAPAIERLGIPAYNWWNEGLHGVARAGRATVFPQAIGLAAAWDADLLLRVATVISDEARAKYHESLRKGRHGIYEGLTFWSPNINLFRDPRWGRGMETYGEDPYLSGRLAVAFVKGMQGEDPRYLKTIATPKHFAVHSGPEPDRHVFDAVVDERDLRETYLPQFRAAVVEGGAQSVMCAYNRFRGTPCCGSNLLLQNILREEWGFDGYVVSDCWALMDFYTTHKAVGSAPEAAAMALRAGVDLNCGVTYDSLGVAVRKGLVGEPLVDQAVRRLFRARFRLGMFDPPGEVHYSRIPADVIDAPENRELAREAARRSIVLLKNKNGVLPLSKNLHRIAVIGPNADDPEILPGNYNGIPSAAVTPLEGIRRAVGPGTEVIYARGCDVAENVPSLVVVPAEALAAGQSDDRRSGLTGEYFANNRLSGSAVLSRIDTAVDFTWWDGPAAPGLPDSFSVRWTGSVVPPVSGTYDVGLSVLGAARLYLDDSLLLEADGSHEVATRWKQVRCTAGELRRIRLEYLHRRPDAIVRLLWSAPDPDLKRRALDAVKEADVIVMCMGLSPRLEGEEMNVHVPGFSGGDRVSIGLPAPQEDLIREVAASGKPLVLVLLNGSALGIAWEAEHLEGILEAWYPGEAGGDAIADVLFGDCSPSGRLPVTFYASADDLPPFTDYAMKGRTYRYFRGTPVYPFGFGLSYTKFRYSNLHRPAAPVRASDTVHISADVENVGAVAGEESIQLYVKRRAGGDWSPLRSLAGFRHIILKPGEKKKVEFALEPRQLSFLDDQNRRVVEGGEIQVSVGGIQPDDVSVRLARGWDSIVQGRFFIGGSAYYIDEK